MSASGPSAFARGRIVILATGGTIAGAAETALDTVGYTSAVTPVDRLLAGLPELCQAAEVKGGEQIAQIGSQDMTDEVWLKLAKRTNALLAREDIDGVVITHGTDTMEETAYFLNLTVKSRKPAVLVGSLRPGSAISADGPMNIYNAAAVAAHPKAAGCGVLVVLNDTIHGARAVAKTSTFLLNAFTSPDFGVLGYVSAGEPKFYAAATRRHTVSSEFDVSALSALPQVDIVYGYAGAGAWVAVEAFVKAGAKGLVHAGVGNGGIHKDTLPALIDARKRGVMVARSSRVGGGLVVRNGEISDDAHDFVAADSLTPQKARVLLQLILACRPEATGRQVQEYFYQY
ncbi:MAG: type II asparaginase [Planctomycetes bacterium]|nr:type II asparaginase [Planctomycetota bacterium]